MDISYRSKKMKKIFDSGKNLQKEYGDLAKKIQLRMTQLSIADTLKDIPRVPPPRCHELSGEYKGALSVDLNHNMRLLFRPDMEEQLLKDDRGLNWGRITRIQIIGVIDTH